MSFEPIAVIGLACRAVGVETPADLWDTAFAGRRRFDIPGKGWWSDQPADQAAEQAKAAYLSDATEFDARLFGISPRMASWMDAQQRISLELAWSALEDAGIHPDRLRGADVAVYAAGFTSDYKDSMVAQGARNAAAFPGTLMTFMANRISYQFDWTGPSMLVDSACSSGLTAVDLAVRSLQTGESSLALVASANVASPGFYTENAMLASAISATGESVPFSADRNGYVRGDGGACLLLKPLAAARADGDPVQAVIHAAGSSHTGRAGGLTGPDSESIGRLIHQVTRRAGVSLTDVGFVEAHGSGTQAGDLAELTGIAAAFEEAFPPDGDAGASSPRLWVGSIKANIGHLEGAAGLIGLVQAITVLQHGVVPPVAGLTTVDDRLPTSEGRIGIATSPEPFPASARLAAVSSFGLGGAMSHVVVGLDSAPDATGRPYGDAALVLPLSARSEAGLKEFAQRLLRHVRKETEIDVARLAWTLQSGRSSWPVRAVVIAADREELEAGLLAVAQGPSEPAVDRLSGDSGPTVRGWLSGDHVDWRTLWGPGEPPARVSAPGSAFERKSYHFAGRA